MSISTEYRQGSKQRICMQNVCKYDQRLLKAPFYAGFRIA